MLAQPEEICALDMWTLVPQILAHPRLKTAPYLAINQGRLEIGRNSQIQRPSSWNNIDVVFPSDAKSYATGSIVLYNPAWNELRVILIVGYPLGSKRYRWRGICPHTLRAEQMLFADPQSELFVSRKALGRLAPISVRRQTEHAVVLDKAKARYGSFDVRQEKQHPNIEGDPNFWPLRKLTDLIHIDALLSESGYPFPVFDENGSLHVLETVRSKEVRERLPERLRSKIIIPNPVNHFQSVETLIAEFKKRGLVIPHHSVLDWAIEEAKTRTDRRRFMQEFFLRSLKAPRLDTGENVTSFKPKSPPEPLSHVFDDDIAKELQAILDNKKY